MQRQSNARIRVPALSEAGLAWAQRMVWAVCIGVYLTVFIGGIQAGGAELMTVARAAAFTLVTAVLGKMALNFLGNASLPVDPGPMAKQDGKLVSLVDLAMAANVPQHQDAPTMAVTGER